MSGRARTKYIRVSPRKVSLVLDRIRGKKVSEAYIILKFINRRAVRYILKTLDSAVANGNAKEIIDQVRIKKAWVGHGPQLKRLRPRAMGRADIIRKPMAHIEIEID